MSEFQKKRNWFLKIPEDWFISHPLDMFDNEQDEHVLIFYQRLMLDSLKHDGRLRFSKTKAYDTKLLSMKYHRSVKYVDDVVERLKDVELLVIEPDGTLFLPEYNKYIGSVSNAAIQKRERESTSTLGQPTDNKVISRDEKVVSLDNKVVGVDEKVISKDNKVVKSIEYRVKSIDLEHKQDTKQDKARDINQPRAGAHDDARALDASDDVQVATSEQPPEQPADPLTDPPPQLPTSTPAQGARQIPTFKQIEQIAHDYSHRRGDRTMTDEFIVRWYEKWSIADWRDSNGKDLTVNGLWRNKLSCEWFDELRQIHKEESVRRKQEEEDLERKRQYEAFERRHRNDMWDPHSDD